VTLIAAVAIGPGGNTGNSGSAQLNGGGGGALSYDNAIVVTPGETLSITVGSVGGDSSIKRGATTLLLAKGASSQTGGQASSGVGAVKYSGGDGASGKSTPPTKYGMGGSAGRYDGDGADGSGNDSLSSVYGGDGANLVGGYNVNTAQAANGTAYGGGCRGGTSGSPVGAQGAVRIMWGTGRSYPSNAGDV
jgi:hypothetical protein